MKKENFSSIEHLYIHFPFCRKKCGYCSFYSRKEDKSFEDSYFEALKRELSFYQKTYNINLNTLYIGGGTPSLMPVGKLWEIISQFDDIEEVTIEVNPADVTMPLAKSWIKCGINRISMGCQSMIDDELEFLGRRHNSNTIETAYNTLRKAGFKNISLDLIYGLPSQKVEDVEYSLRKLIELNPEHVSCYCLSLDEDCRLARWRNRLPDDDLVSEMYYHILDLLESSGYNQYEISNFSKTGMESRHNMAYWESKNYLGCGPAAAGYVPGLRYQNHSDIIKWQKAIEESSYFGEKDLMDNEKERLDYIMLSLRLKKGLDLQEYQEKFHQSFPEKYDKILAEYLKEELMVIGNNRIRLSKKACFISNEVISGFFDHIN